MPPLLVAYCFLIFAVIVEVAGTSFLSKSEQFTKALPTFATAFCFGLAFFCLTQALKQIPLGVAYAFWAGMGISFTAIVGTVFFKQPLDLPGIVGITMIVGGVVVINLFSESSGH